MSEQLTIKCPHCGSILRVPNQPGIEKAVIVCSNCKEKSKFTDCQKVTVKPKVSHDADETQYGSNQYGANSDRTITPDDLKHSTPPAIGRLVVVRTGAELKLKLGNNTIGRQATTSTASIQVPDVTGKRQMSRQHAIIDVNRMPDGTTRHTLRNWNNQNKTLVGGEEVIEGDRIVLISGQIIRMGDIELRFEVDDDEATSTK